MKATGHHAKTPFAKTGSFAMLARVFHGRGSSAPSSSARVWPRAVRLAVRERAAVGCVAVLVGLLLPATAALASGPPHFVPINLEKEIHATRVAIEPELEPEGLSTEWRAEYATSKSAVEKGEGTVSASGTTVGAGSSLLYIGAVAGTAGNNVRYLRHLAPKTAYYARFVAKNADGTAEEMVPFTTLPVGKPEIPGQGGASGSFFGSTFQQHGVFTSTEAGFIAQVESDGAETKYSFEYAQAEMGGQPPASNSLSWQLCASGATGTVSVIEEFADPEAICTGLQPETSYFARVRASNEKGAVEELLPFRTFTAKPVVGEPEVRNASAVSAHIRSTVSPHGSETEWRMEWASSEKALEEGNGSVAAAGTISKAQAEALPFESGVVVEGELTGLKPSSVYYVRVFAENKCASGASGCGSASSAIASFETSGPPSATTFAVHALHGESVRLLGAVNPRSVPTSEEQRITIAGVPTGGSFTLTFKGQSTGPIAFDAPAEGPGGVRTALIGLAGAPEVVVTGLAGGPYTVWFYGKNVEGGQPQIVCDASGLEPKPPAATCTVATTQQGGEVYDTHYHFQYVGQKQFGETAWAGAAETPEVDAGSGSEFTSVGVDLPNLTPGETYRYRMLATNNSPGNPVVDGEEQTLTALTPAPVEAPAVCPNKAFRTGPSANLPDCRAYEQLTPVHKEGSQEPFSWNGLVAASAEAGEDGEHFVLDEPAISWGSGPHAGSSPYFFSREAGGWGMTAAAVQPEFGVHSLTPEVFDPNLTALGFESASTVGTEDIAFEAGPPGGPYTTVASVPRKQVQVGLGWVAASGDFSKLVLATAGNLYEYSGGELRQLNVGVGACGARIAHGDEQGATDVERSGPHSLSHDGSRVFFEAVPGCSGPTHTFIRVNGSETVDLGAGSFLAANEDGSEVLLEKNGGEGHEVVLYDTATAVESKLFSAKGTVREDDLHVSAGPHLSALYFSSAEQLTPGAPSVSPSQSGVSDLYRYDIPGRALGFLLQATSVTGVKLISSVSPDGRYAYFGVETIGGLPGGAKLLHWYHQSATEGPKLAPQVYRYDSAEQLVQCVSCASPSDPEPRLASVLFSSDGHFFAKGGLPSYTAVSANGDFAFFTTPAALLPSDVDGEVAPENGTERGVGNAEFADRGGFTSPSSDIYEWRRDGLDGCTHLNGCLALISNGRGGFLTLLLGSAHEGRDVFIYTSSQLLPQDKDTAGDIYDVRIGGGFPQPPPAPVECEADACSTPPAAPIDSTPASLSFSGPGNLAPVTTPAHKAKHKAKKHARKLKSKRHGRKAGGKARKSNHRKGR